MSSTNDDHDAGDDYLWDRSGPPDPEIAALERRLSSRRWSGRLPDADVAPLAPRDRALRRLPRALTIGLLAAAALVIGLALWHGAREPHADDAASPDAVYSVESSTGDFHVEDARPGDGALVAGSRLVTQAGSHLTLRVGPIGSVRVEGDTRLRIEQPEPATTDATDGAGGYLLYLERGRISATIFAAPRLFQLGTPSGIAVDMGCAYTVAVDDAGITRLAVTVGQVSFETPQRKVLVPAGAGARAWPGRGPGTPVWDDATPAFREAVEWLDERAAAEAPAGALDVSPSLTTVLATDRGEDSLSLWHLIDSGCDAEVRGRVYDRLAALEPPPAGVTREGCLARERMPLDTWRDTLGWAWSATR